MLHGSYRWSPELRLWRASARCCCMWACKSSRFSGHRLRTKMQLVMVQKIKPKRTLGVSRHFWLISPLTFDLCFSWGYCYTVYRFLFGGFPLCGAGHTWQGQSWVEQCLSEDVVTVAVSDNMTVPREGVEGGASMWMWLHRKGCLNHPCIGRKRENKEN